MIDSLAHSGAHMQTLLHSGRSPGQGQMPTGFLQGQPVQQLDHASVLADAADELTQQLSTKAEEKSLRERRIGKADNKSSLRSAEFHALLLALQSEHQNEEQQEEQLLALARRIQRQPARARQEAARLHKDASAQYLSLLEVAQLLREGQLTDVGGRALAAVEDAADELEAEHGDAIWADINVLKASQEHQNALDEPGAAQAFRQTYKEAVLGAADLSSTLRALLDKHKDRQAAAFTQVLQDMVKAMGADLAAVRPSRDPVKLQALLSDLYHLGVIATVLETCDELGRTLQTQFNTLPIRASELTSELAGLSAERWVDAARFDSLARQHRCDAPASCKVAFLAGIRRALKELPLQVFPSAEARQSVLDAAQLALDRATDLEAEEY
jgi:type III secretion protein W